MSAADLFEDGFPHGTPEGYAPGGCKSGACPGKADFGMSCRMAWQAERSDRRYRRLADEGAPPPVIALELGLVEPEHLAPAAAVAVAAWRAASNAAPTADQAAAAAELARAGVSAEDIDGAASSAVAIAADVPARPRPDVDLSRPARIRQWARESGLQVGVMGPLPRAVIAAYDEAHSTPERSDEPEQSPALVVDLTNPAPVGSITVETVPEVPEVPEHTEHTEPSPLPRPDFGQAMVDVDVERARRIAVRLEQELAKVEAERDQALADVHTVTASLAREQRIAASAEAEAAALRRALADRARRGRRVGAFLRRVVSR